MGLREAKLADIAPIQKVRNAVKENTLSNPALVSDEDVREFLFERGKGWVFEMNGQIVGFSIADLKDENIWALFVHPDFDRKGIGRQLHDAMLDWYFSQNKTYVWLGTAPNTRAEKFYELSGWAKNGVHGSEIKFEMTSESWKTRVNKT